MTAPAWYFGDSEPEDAWQIDDPTPVLLKNLERRCARLGVPAEPRGYDARARLDAVADALAVIRRRRSADAVYVDLLARHVDVVDERIDHG